MKNVLLSIITYSALGVDVVAFYLIFLSSSLDVSGIQLLLLYCAYESFWV